MIVGIENGFYDTEKQEFREDLKMLRTQGCTCCSNLLEPTKENVEKAIKEHEEMIETLKAFL